MGGTKRKPELLEHREQSVNRWVGPVVPEVVGHMEGTWGFLPRAVRSHWRSLSVELQGPIEMCQRWLGLWQMPWGDEETGGGGGMGVACS